MGEEMNDTADLRDPHRTSGAFVVGAVLAGAFAFGALDQYLGSRNLFGTGVSELSAPWLLLPFAAGSGQLQWRRAAWLGLAATWLALLGDVLMIVSPVEGVHLTPGIFAASASSQLHWFLCGLISGPLYGVLGNRWRLSRSWPAAALAAAPLILEPVAAAAGLLSSTSAAADCAEAVAGLLLAGFFAVAIARSRQRPLGAA
jgi:hypothetical protein